jgi:hypothetical protein
MTIMGIDEDAIEAAKLAEFERKESRIRRKRSHSVSADKRNSTKALEWLGLNPSQDKIMSTLGMDYEERGVAEQENAEIFEEQLEVRFVSDFSGSKFS